MTTVLEPIETIFDHPDRARGKFITADGYRTHYLEAGDPAAEPLVLVHGGTSIGTGVDRWYPTVLPLAQRFHVFAVDEIGHGETDPPRDPHHLGHVRYRAEHVIAFIEALGVGPVHLVGQSQGGWQVAYISLKRPDLVRRMVLVDSASTAGAGLTSEGLPYFKKLFKPGTMVPKLDLTSREGIRAQLETFVERKEAITDEFLDRQVVLSAKWRQRYLDQLTWFWSDNALERQRDVYSYEGQHISESVHRISVPTLVIWGKQSVKGIDAGVELYKKIPDAQMHIFDRANHFLWLDHPRDFNSLVTWFLT